MIKWFTGQLPALIVPRLPWLLVGLLSISCITLAVVQNRWIYQVSLAERERLHNALQTDLNRLSGDFDASLASTIAALTPSFEEVESQGSETACSLKYQSWKQDHEPVFRRIGLWKQQEFDSGFYLLDMETGVFSSAQWPDQWGAIRRRLEPQLEPPGLLEVQLFGSWHRPPPGSEGPERRGLFQRPANHDGGHGPGRPPQQFHGPRPEEPRDDRMILELSSEYVGSTLLPDLVKKDLVSSGESNYDVQIISQAQPRVTIVSASQHSQDPEGSVGLLDISRLGRRDRAPGRDRRPPGRTLNPVQAQWRLLVWHRGRSLDTEVTTARWRNIALSGGILLLILTMVVISLHYARRSQHLARLQMNFVAGVSHELRTPLTVIRTAAYNLRGRVASRPDQVEKYGQLIQNESEKLSILVDQVLRYGAITSGRVIGERHVVDVGRLVESSIATSSAGFPGGQFTVEKRIDADLPLILADELAMKHALTNLMDNAVKYGLEGSDWIGISAEAVPDSEPGAVEIRVADRGPGIPAAEQDHLFDAFFRGRRAVEDQIHGTGLGLNLVKSIIEAHGGTIRVSSGPNRGAEFIVRVPAAAREVQDVFANTIS